MGAGDETTILNEPGIGSPKDATESDGGGGKIRCPICGWTPESDSKWMCTCKHLWNTFDTGGVCPACMTRWAFTMCPSCGSWSPHSDWYLNL